MTHVSSQPTADKTRPGQHGYKQHTDGGWGLVPVQTRSERFRSFNAGDFPHVTGREIEWQLTPVTRINTLTGGELDGSPYEFTASTADGITVGWIDRDDPVIGRAGKPEERASANAWSSFDRALHISVTGDDQKTVSVARADCGSAARAAHTVITAEPFSRGTIVLENSGDALLSENVEIVLGESAELTIVSAQQWNAEAVHLASQFAVIGRNARLKHVVVTLGGGIVRVNPSVHLSNEGGEAEMYGVYYADAHQHLEHRVFVNHDAPHTRSRVTYKGALQGDGARTVWVGDVLIRSTAPATDSYEENRNLILTDGARADSIPNLEIETGEIAGAGHASTTGRFDDEQLFYLQSRGVPADEAKRLVVRGFLGEIVQQVGAGELQTRIMDAIEAELAGSPVA